MVKRTFITSNSNLFFQSPMDTENQTLDPNPNPNPTNSDQQWESAAREWLSSLPESGTPLTVTAIEAWVNSYGSSLPDRITSLSPQQLFQQFTSIQNSILPLTEPTEEKDTSVVEHPYRFQRSDVWKPVYTWLESFDTDNLIKSQDILDWLTENPEIREQLYVKHSRYHVMHYIKKCHIKILKRREKKKGVQPTNIPNPIRIPKTEAINRPVPVPCNASNNLPKDRDMYAAKRSEAVQKYEILLELEKQLSVLFPKPQTVD